MSMRPDTITTTGGVLYMLHRPRWWDLPAWWRWWFHADKMTVITSHETFTIRVARQVKP